MSDPAKPVYLDENGNEVESYYLDAQGNPSPSPAASGPTEQPQAESSGIMERLFAPPESAGDVAMDYFRPGTQIAMAKGLFKGAADTATHLGKMTRRVAAATGLVDPESAAFEAASAELEPQNPGESAGRLAERGAEFIALPGAGQMGGGLRGAAAAGGLAGGWSMGAHGSSPGEAMMVAALAGAPGVGAQAPRLVRAAASPAGLGAITAGVGMATGQKPTTAITEGVLTAAGLKAPGVAGKIARAGEKVAGAMEGLPQALRAGLSHLIRRELPDVAEASATGTMDRLLASRATTSGTVPVSLPAAAEAAPAARGASTSTFPGMSVPAPAVEAPAAAAATEAAAPAAAPAARGFDPRQIEPGGWKEVGIENWYGTKGGPTEADWRRMGGAKAQRAWLESRNLIPGANTPQDVAAAASRNVPKEQIEKLYGTERAPAKVSKADQIKAARETLAKADAPPAEKAAAAKAITDPKAQAESLAEEVAAKVRALQQQGLSRTQIAASLRDTHGIPKGPASKMVTMILGPVKSTRAGITAKVE